MFLRKAHISRQSRTGASMLGRSTESSTLSERRKPGVNATEIMSRLRSSRAMAKAGRMTKIMKKVTAVVKSIPIGNFEK
jgi:hypothetical protein